MKTVRFEISDEDFAILSEIAARFYEGGSHGDGRPYGIKDLAKLALLEKRESMLWAINKNQPWESPANAIPGPWKPGKRGKVEA